MRKISIAIPTFNRYQMTIDSFKQVLDDERVFEVVICDDASTDDSWVKLCDYFKDTHKIVLVGNQDNIDCYANKHRAVENTVGRWCILLDSDNTIDKSYLDALYAIKEWDEKFFYLPEFARPHFSALQWSGLVITKENAAQYADTHLSTNWNAMNFFINREEYLRVWDGSVNPNTSDSIYFSYCWLNAGNKIYITPDLQYDHFIDPHGNGHYNLNYKKAIQFHEDLMNKIRQLK